MQDPGCHLCFWPTSYKSEFPPLPAWAWSFARTAYRTQGNGCLGLQVYCTIRGIIKEPDEQPEEGVHRVRSGSVPSTGASVCEELGCTTLPTCGPAPQPGSSLNPLLSGFLWRLHQVLSQHSTSSPSTLSGGGEFQASNLAVVFLVTRPHPGAHWEAPQ